jgi:vacuolar-type H+-ATPase subunit F/Vma7
MEFYVVADEDTVQGFRYAGIAGAVVRDGREAAAELDRLAKAQADLIIITTQQVANSAPDKVREIRFTEELPLIVEIPGPEGPTEESADLLRLIREAVGIMF